jgi:hypothetical protein
MDGDIIANPDRMEKIDAFHAQGHHLGTRMAKRCQPCRSIHEFDDFPAMGKNTPWPGVHG